MAAPPAQNAQEQGVVRRMQRSATDLTSPARYGWETEQVEAIRRTVAKDCNDAEFVMFLELAARYRLDPFARQIWAARMSDKPDSPVAILVGRDGLLSVCERYDTFEGMDSDVVVQGDKLTRDPETREYIHEWGDDHLTGDILGAWATVWRSDRKRPTCWYARFDEYNKPNSKFWARFKSAMIVKCAESMSMKRAFTITGLLIEEEVSEYPEHGVISRAATIEWGDDPRLADWLQALVEAANAARKNAYRPQKVLALLKGRSDADRCAFAQELVDHIANFDKPIPEPPLGLARLDGRHIVWDATVMIESTATVIEAEPPDPTAPEPSDPGAPDFPPGPEPTEPTEPTEPADDPPDTDKSPEEAGGEPVPSS
jgi:phage recombination protein Bet